MKINNNHRILFTLRFIEKCPEEISVSWQYKTKQNAIIHRVYSFSIKNYKMKYKMKAIRSCALSVIILLNLFVLDEQLFAQKNQKAIIAYYAGSPEKLDSFDAKLMTHI